jgi:hypothetical protein
MPIVTNHSNSETDVTITGGSVVVDSTFINDVLTQIKNLKNDVQQLNTGTDYKEIYNDSTLDNGGIVGDLLHLMRVHINDSIRKGELSKDMSGQAYVAAISEAVQASIQIYTVKSDSRFKYLENKLKLFDSLIGSYTNLMSMNQTEIDAKIKEFTLKELMPLDRELKKEDIEYKHKSHSLLDEQIITEQKRHAQQDVDKNIASYNLSDMLPTEKLLKVEQKNDLIKRAALTQKEIDLKSYELTNIYPQKLLESTAVRQLKEKQLDFESYKFTNMLPLEKIKLTHEVALSDAQALLMGVEKDIKLYYKTDIQPEEKKLAQSKARIESINAALGGNVIDSLPAKRMAVIDKQLLVYDKQIAHYADQKDLDLLKMMTSYQSMIYPDLTGTSQAIFSFANSTNASTVFSRLNN